MSQPTEVGSINKPAINRLVSRINQCVLCLAAYYNTTPSAYVGNAIGAAQVIIGTCKHDVAVLRAVSHNFTASFNNEGGGQIWICCENSLNQSTRINSQCDTIRYINLR